MIDFGQLKPQQTIAVNYSQHAPAKYPLCVISEHCSQRFDMIEGDPIVHASDPFRIIHDRFWTIEAPVHHCSKLFSARTCVMCYIRALLEVLT